MNEKKRIEFLDEEEHKFSQKIDYDQILANQIDKVRLSGSVEFRGGYWEQRNKMIGGSLINEKVYVPDTRQVYIGSVDQLYDLFIPFLDKRFKKENENIEKDIKKLNEKREGKQKELKIDAFNVWYYSHLLKFKRLLYRQLIFLTARLGLCGIKKSKEEY